ncbi:hypothetical protein AX14_014221 [Amanita brunnescens Koide BX004]|nr:hypothetical protein AX14_014221 [Amanita brunnescens Koide BX004]
MFLVCYVFFRLILRLAHPLTISLEVLPRSNYLHARNERAKTLFHDDSFRLTISAFDETFHLHLRPNDHLIHPAARITYYSTAPDGSVQKKTTPLLRETVKAYWGEVIAAYHSPTRMRQDAARVVHYPHPAELGFARIMVHDQGNNDLGIAPKYEGAFSVHGEIYHIMTKHNYLIRKHPLDPPPEHDDMDTGLVIWRESDIMTPAEEHSISHAGLDSNSVIPAGKICGYDRLTYNGPGENPILQKSFQTSSQWVDPLWVILGNNELYARDDVAAGGSGMDTNFVNNIGDSTGCPQSQKVVYMGVAADCEYVTKYGTQDDARQAILTNWNTASALYKGTFNVSLGIVELQVQPPTCPSQPDPTLPWNIPCSSAALDDRLSIFSQWRGQKGQDGAGLWHLMSGCPSGTEVGIAWLATLCQTNATPGSSNQSVSGTAVSTYGLTEWQVVAHEIGHNFGAIHDCTSGCNITDSCCPSSTTTCDSQSQFIMNPISQSMEKTFSPCSLGNICSLMGGGSQLTVSCVVDPDPNKQVISLQMCGNGIVEDGEDCDPGSNVTSTCCDSATCKFTSGAICDPASSPCCTAQCSFAPSTQVCRPAKDTRCDFAENCTGNSSACPPDHFAPNGQSCGSGLNCASGQCTSLSLQCQSIGGSMGLNTSCPNHGDTSCQVSCQDPTKANTCVILGALLVDGSPCGYGGTCSSGKCQPGSVMAQIKAWYAQNLQIAIPATIAAGILLLLLVWILVSGSYVITVCDRKHDLYLLKSIAIMRCVKGNRRAAIKEQHLRHQAKVSSYYTGFSQPPMGGTSRSGVPFIPTDGSHSPSMSGNQR